jgi:hypothetical protein
MGIQAKAKAAGECREELTSFMDNFHRYGIRRPEMTHQECSILLEDC